MLWIYIYSFVYLYSLLGLKLMRGNCQVSRVESFVDAAPLGINTCRLQCTYFRVNGGSMATPRRLIYMLRVFRMSTSIPAGYTYRPTRGLCTAPSPQAGHIPEDNASLVCLCFVYGHNLPHITPWCTVATNDKNCLDRGIFKATTCQACHPGNPISRYSNVVDVKCRSMRRMDVQGQGCVP